MPIRLFFFIRNQLPMFNIFTMANLFKLCLLAFVLMSGPSYAQMPPIESDNMSVSTNEKVDLKILSWNIYMLEERFLIFTGQRQRAALIAALLAKEDYDVIVFEEAFNDKAREIIADGLAEKYPYQIGPLNNKKGLFKTSSGVWILSSVELKTLKEIEYSDCAGFDCNAHKGAVMLEGIKDGHAFQIVGTHLQAFDGEKRENIRVKQYQQMRDELLVPFERDDVPQFVCGDFNTIKKSKRYVPMLELLNADDGDLNTSLTYAERNTDKNKKKLPNEECVATANEPCTYATNDYRVDTSNVEYNATLDYILCRQKLVKNKQKPQITRRTKAFRTPWFFKGKHRKDLSDHYAVEADVNWNNPNPTEIKVPEPSSIQLPEPSK